MTDTPTNVVPLEGIKIAKLDVVTPWLIRGAQPSKAALKQLSNAGVRTVINLRWSSDALREERQWILETEMNYVVIPLTYLTLPTRAQINKFLSVLDDSANHPVYVHCQHGVDRTGMMMAIWRIARQNWTAHKAYAEMRDSGFHKFPMYHFKIAVYNFADRWERALKNAPPAESALKVNEPVNQQVNQPVGQSAEQ
jgi:protein tyrosine/serine phosphatase